MRFSFAWEAALLGKRQVRIAANRVWRTSSLKVEAALRSVERRNEKCAF